MAKTATEILHEYGINPMNMNDEFNSQLFAAMEKYAEQNAVSVLNIDSFKKEWLTSDMKKIIHGAINKNYGWFVPEFFEGKKSHSIQNTIYETCIDVSLNIVLSNLMRKILSEDVEDTWIKYPENETPFDGQYYVCIKRENECGTVTYRHAIIANNNNKFSLPDTREQVTHFSMLKTEPKH